MELLDKDTDKCLIGLSKKESYFYHKKAALSDIQFFKENDINYNSTRNSAIFEKNYVTPLNVENKEHKISNINFFSSLKATTPKTNGTASTISRYLKDWSKLNKNKFSEKKPKLINISSPQMKVAENSCVQVCSKPELPNTLKNLYKKYLTTQNENHTKDIQSQSCEPSKTLSIDTFNTEMPSAQVDQVNNESNFWNQEANCSELVKDCQKNNCNQRVIMPITKLDLDCQKKDCTDLQLKLTEHEMIKPCICNGDTGYFTSYKTSIDENNNQISVQFYDGFPNNEFPLVTDEDNTLNLEFSRQSSTLDIDLSDILVQINNL